MGDTRKRRSTKKENTPTVPEPNKVSSSEKETIRKKLQSKNYKNNSANSDNSPTASIVKTLIFSILIFVAYLFISSNNFEILFDLKEKIQKYTKSPPVNIQKNHAVPDAIQQSNPQQSASQPKKQTIPAAYAKYYKQLKPKTPKPADIELILKKSRSHLDSQNAEVNLTSEASCHYRRLLGLALSIKAENQRSNSILKESIKEMNLMPPTCDKHLVIANADLLSERCEFIGMTGTTISHLKKILKIHPELIEFHNKIGISYLLQGKNEESIASFEKTIEHDAENSLALVNLGWAKGKLAEKIPAGEKQKIEYLNSADIIQKGLDSIKREKMTAKTYEEVNNARYYRQLADAYLRTGNRRKHDEVNELAASRNVYPSKYQRSSYNVDGLKAQPWWSPKEANIEKLVEKLEKHYLTIQKEAMAIFEEHKHKMEKEAESLSIDNGKSDWRQFTFYERGRKNQKNCELAPKTCQIIEKIGGKRVTACKRGQTKFSVMVPGTEVWPHVGPSNTRLRLHLGLKVPPDAENVRITCGGVSKHWEEGKAFIFDDSFEHEVSHQASTSRMILIMDVWHPELTQKQIDGLTPI